MLASRLRVLACAFLVLVAYPAQAQEGGLETPASYLGYELGTHFTPHHRVLDYVRHVARRSPAVTVRQYGTSYEGRPLVVATITTPNNQSQIGTIRQSNLQRAGMISGTPDAEESVVWLSYNVHGDESVSSEAALKTLHALGDTSNVRTQRWLEDTVVLLDPCLNPDGRQRYVSWFRQTVGTVANADPSAREHHAPWAPGRTNHYYFDLNRDWAWGVQKETQARLTAYQRWMPNIHVDYHEMGIDDPYYFAPAADPYHETLTDWQREFQFVIGRNNASYFDENGWLYFTREVYDLFYPGYGDTWPLFNGAIGLTYEQAGGASAGRAVITADGDTLTLADRIAHHHTTALSTIEVAAENHQEIVQEFAAYYESAVDDPPGPYDSYIVRRRGDGERVEAIASTLDRQGIRYGYATDRERADGRAFTTGQTQTVQIQPGDLVIDASQPKARLLKVLFEPETTVIDSLMYDITAWGLPYAYGVDAFALRDRVIPDTAGTPPEEPAITGNTNRPYAYVARWRSRADARFAAALLEADVRVRFATEGFTVDQRTYPPGTLVLPRTANAERLAAFDETVQRIARRHDQPLHAIQTGFTEEGPDLGSSSVRVINNPTVAVLSGPPTSSSGVGEVWHFFDQRIDYPAMLLPADDVAASMLDDVDVLVLPDGHYDGWLTDERTDVLTTWVKNGGHLLALGNANGALADTPGYQLTQKETEDSTGSTQPDAQPSQYGMQQRNAVPGSTPGSIHRVWLDTSHPLGFGLESPYFSLKRNDATYAYLKDGWTVGALQEPAPVSGFMGHQAQKKVDDTLLFGTQRLGEGHVVYLVDNPLFRGFWYAGDLLFSNAVFLVGNR